MTLDVLKSDGTKTGRTVDLAQDYFEIEPNDHAIYLVVKQYLANQRQGTHKAKEKSEVSGSTRKLHRQKGTGGSRKGSIKSPLFSGGARVFGPRPRDYSFKLNKKVRDLAKKSALSQKAKDQAIAVVENFELPDHKTRNYAEILDNLGLVSKKTILVIDELNDNLKRASRNISSNRVMKASDLNTYDILNCKTLLFTEGSLALFKAEK
jgi:large subunit ribosomal protein L4